MGVRLLAAPFDCRVLQGVGLVPSVGGLRGTSDFICKVNQPTTNITRILRILVDHIQISIFLCTTPHLHFLLLPPLHRLTILPVNFDPRCTVLFIILKAEGVVFLEAG